MGFRTLTEFALGIAFGLLLSIPVRAQLRVTGSTETPKNVNQFSNKGAKQKLKKKEKENPSLSLSNPAKECERAFREYYRHNIFGEWKQYDSEEKRSLKKYLSSWLKRENGPAITLKVSKKLRLRLPIDWKHSKQSQSPFFQMTSKSGKIRGIFFSVPRKGASKSALLNEYFRQSHKGDNLFPYEVLKGEKSVPEEWDGTNYVWLTKTKVEGHWLHYRRIVIFKNDSVYILAFSAWDQLFDIWDQFFLKASTDFARQVLEKQ